MNSLKIQRLSEKHSDLSIDILDFAKRIKNAYIFNSIDECISYINALIDEECLNPDFIGFESYINTAPILYINIIDESVACILHELILLRYRKDYDTIGYIRVKLDELISKLQNASSKMISHTTKYYIYQALAIMLDKITVLAIPLNTDIQEINYGSLSVYYYNLMYTMYSQLRPMGANDVDYFKRNRYIYFSYLEDSYRENAPIEFDR